MSNLVFRLRDDADVQDVRLPAGTVVAEVQSNLDAAVLRRMFATGRLDLCLAEIPAAAASTGKAARGDRARSE